MPSDANEMSGLTYEQVGARLSRPPKKNLDPTSWQCARPSLIELVTAMRPTSETSAVRFHSHLCDFLRRSPWRPGEPLNWRALLSSEAVDRHRDEQIRERLSQSLIDGHRATLHRAQRALAGEEPDYRAGRVSKPVGTGSGATDQAVLVRLATAVAGSGGGASTLRTAFCTAVSQGVSAGAVADLRPSGDALRGLGLTPARLQRLTLQALVDTDCPVVDMAAALASHAVLTAERLDGALRRLAACGAATGAVTVDDVHLQRMTSAAAPDVKEIALKKNSSTPTRPPSRAALQRAAKAELDAVAARYRLLDPRQPLPDDLDVTPEVKAKVLKWSPARHNKITPEALAPVRELLVRLVLASEPGNAQKAVALCGHLAGFLVWGWTSSPRRAVGAACRAPVGRPAAARLPPTPAARRRRPGDRPQRRHRSIGDPVGTAPRTPRGASRAHPSTDHRGPVHDC